MSDGTANARQREILDVIDRLSAAFGTRDVDQVMAFFPQWDDLRVFDLAPPVELIGFETSRKKLTAFFAGLQPNPVVRWHDVRVAADERLAYASGLLEFSATNTDGAALRQNCRSTLVFERIDGRWLIVHEHDSVPMDFNIPGYG